MQITVEYEAPAGLRGAVAHQLRRLANRVSPPPKPHFHFTGPVILDRQKLVQIIRDGLRDYKHDDEADSD